MGAAEALFAGQAADCEAMGSPFTARVLRLVVGLLDPATPLGAHILNAQAVRADALPLRLAGGLHAMARAGDPDLAPVYPPFEVGDAVLAAGLAAFLARRGDALMLWMGHAPQTNEVARSAVLIAAGHWLTARFGLPLVLTELGASAGVNLLWDHYALEIVVGDSGLSPGDQPGRARCRQGIASAIPERGLPPGQARLQPLDTRDERVDCTINQGVQSKHAPTPGRRGPSRVVQSLESVQVCEARTFGPPDAALILGPDWTGNLPPLAPPVVRARAGVDLAPLDPAADRDRMLAYIWADQPARRARAEAALSLAARLRPRVDQGDAGDWAARALALRHVGAVHLVYHTIAAQYFPPATRAVLAGALAHAGAAATLDAPLAHLAMEADGGQEGAALTLTLWPGGETLTLGRADFHGRWVRWAAPAP